MANAWCINAISFDWCFLETLQQLDSACIWVWVQYTAPDPLYDKRIDYITYTDKCWCSCCLSWENEILILATQWTLKNLTLTNDDTNEVVNVKRTDLFWSNWKKTVVRYKTWSFPTSVTDWTLAVEETTMNQYSSTWFDVSWLDDATTYYFSVFAIAQDDTVIVVQSDSITTDFGRKPSSNTLLYYPLTSNLVDQMWNGATWVKHWNVTFNANPWSTTWCYVYGSSSIYVTWMSIWINWKSTCTMNVWTNFISKTEHWNIVWYNSNYNYGQPFKIFGWNNSSNVIWFNIMRWTNSSNHWTVWMYNDWSLLLNSWYHNFCVTVDNLVVKFFVDWVNTWIMINWVIQQSYTMPRAIASWTSECQLWRWWVYWSWRTARWYVRDYIVETVAWTERDVLNYYNKTKSNFWLS